MREKLIELLIDLDMLSCDKMRRCDIERHADYLLENSVVVLPCKAEDAIFVIPTKENKLTEITEMRCLGFSLGEPNDTVNLSTDKNKLYQPSFDKFGKTVFLTKEEAEKVLERSK